MATKGEEKVKAIIIDNLSVLLRQNLPSEDITSDKIERNLNILLENFDTNLSELATNYEDGTTTPYFLFLMASLIKKNMEDEELPPLEDD